MCLLVPVPSCAHAELQTDQLPAGPIGLSARIIQEAPGVPLDMAQAAQRFDRGEGRPATRAVLSAGIDAPGVWMHWRIRNTGREAERLRLTVDNAWVDSLTIVVQTPGEAAVQWQAGDALPYASRPIPTLGFSVEHDFAPGVSELYLRARTADPLVLPVYLEPPGQAAAREQQGAYFHAFVYGYLIALMAYNLLIWAGVKKRGHLLYALYLACFVAANLAYTGHGYAWLWPNQPEIQRYMILIFMVAFAISGVLFALRFLEIPSHAPTLAHRVRLACGALVVFMGAPVIFGAHALAAQIAFLSVLLMPLGMLGLGVVALRADVRSAGYFLMATVCGMGGALLTALTVLGIVTYGNTGFRAAEIGMLADATLLALALAQRLRHNEADRQRAEALARIDPLTRLLNRRAFHEQARPLWHAAVRSGRPLAAIMLDLDRFKALNDDHGHAMGDQALQQVAGILSNSARRSDVVTRWGGEEFALLLPDTDTDAAEQLAERLRIRIHSTRIGPPKAPIELSASLGVAERTHAGSLEELIMLADDHLRIAKRGGRDRVIASRHVAPKASDRPVQPIGS